MQVRKKAPRQHSAAAGHGHGTGGARGAWRFTLHFLEMLVAMAVGMLVLGAAVQGALALAGIEFTAARYPELSSLAMAAEMSVGMAAWMRVRGHGWAGTLEMCGVMFAPAVVLFPLLWLGAVTAGSMSLIEHLAMPPLMLLVMLRRRGEFTH